MDSEHTLKLTNEFAIGYDSYISNKDWCGPELIFDLLKTNIKPGKHLLDIGIGTGLASIPFNNAGLKIYGIDGSEEMIRLCALKKITEKLILSDIADKGLQLPDIKFDYIISNAVFHMVGKLGHIFNEVSEHLKPNGCFCFTIIPFNKSKPKNFFETETPGIFSKINNENEPKVYHHTQRYIQETLCENNMEMISSQVFMAFKDNDENKEVFLEVFLSKKVSDV